MITDRLRARCSGVPLSTACSVTGAPRIAVARAAVFGNSAATAWARACRSALLRPPSPAQSEYPTISYFDGRLALEDADPRRAQLGHGRRAQLGAADREVGHDDRVAGRRVDAVAAGEADVGVEHAGGRRRPRPLAALVRRAHRLDRHLADLDADGAVAGGALELEDGTGDRGAAASGAGRRPPGGAPPPARRCPVPYRRTCVGPHRR